MFNCKNGLNTDLTFYPDVQTSKKRTTILFSLINKLVFLMQEKSKY